MFISAVNSSCSLCSFSSQSPLNVDVLRSSYSSSVSYARFPLKVGSKATCVSRCVTCRVNSVKCVMNSDNNPDQKPKSIPKEKSRNKKTQNDENAEKQFSPLIPKKPRRGRKSEAAAVEDFVRDSLEKTFESMRKQNPDLLKKMENIIKEKSDEKIDSYDSSDDDDEDSDEEGDEKKMLVEEEDPNWPLDADVGWGIKASEYFEQHPIRNVMGDDGHEIDWEGEIDEGWVKEINCLEWESFAFHPSPLIVLVFERYNRASDNWKVLKELEKAAKVYWEAKDRLPPRTVKIDMKIERDLAYALKVKECPQILFLRGNKILYREKEIRSADELVQMIAYFYYNAKKPPCVNDSALSSKK